VPEKLVKVTFTPDGKVQVEGMGFSGPACEQEIDRVLEDLHLEARDQELKDEYYLKNSLTGRI
jgi:hypothetical protein